MFLRDEDSFFTQMFYNPRDDGSSEEASLAIERSPAELSQAPCYPLCRQMVHMCTPKTLANWPLLVFHKNTFGANIF